MQQLSGIDFSGLIKFREAVTATLPDGTVAELPLIKLRDAHIATSFLREHEMIVSRFAVLGTKSSAKSKLLEAVQDEHGDTEEASDKELEVLGDTADALIAFQRENRELIIKLNALGDEIIKFIEPYFTDSNVIECLKQFETKYTIKVLQLMLYGAEFIKASDTAPEEASEAKNPTETPSQNS